MTGERAPGPLIDRNGVRAYPIEIAPPNIDSLRLGNTGVDYVHRIESGCPGPTVVLNALTHGNEYSGAVALKWLLESGSRPTRGRWLVSFANVGAFLSFDPAAPDASRFLDVDMNRVWEAKRLDPNSTQYEVGRARALCGFVRSADYLLDLHSMHESCEPLLLAGLTDKAFAFSQKVGFPRSIIRDEGHSDGKRMIDFERFGDPQSHCVALLLEAGQHWGAESVDLSFHTLFRFLLATETIDAPNVPSQWRHAVTQTEIRVVGRCVATSSQVRFTQDWKGMEVIERAGTIIAYDDGVPVATPFDACVLVMPSLRQVLPGVTYVRFGQEVAPNRC